jgi:MFS family permease
MEPALNPAGAGPAAPATRPGYKWWVVFMLWFVCFFNYADRQAISSVLPLLAKDFNFDDLQLGLIGSAFAWIYAGAAPFAGMTADRATRKKIIIAACVVWSGFTLATAWCGNFSSFVFVRALTGLAEAFYFPAAMSLISDVHAPGTRSRAMALHQSAVYGGTILGSWLAAVLAEKSGWNIPFLMFGPIGILLAIVVSRFLREPERDAADRACDRRGDEGQASFNGGTQSRLRPASSLSVAETWKIIFRSPAALLLMAAFLCANFVAFIFLTWTPKFLFDKFHYSLGAAGLTGAVFINLASAVSVPFAGLIADKCVRRFPTGRMLVQFAGLLAGAVFVFLVGHTANVGVLILAMTCFGICKGFYDSGIFASLYDTIEPRARGSAAGLMNTVGWGGGALGPVFVGWVTKHGHYGSESANMGHAIALGGAVYLIGAGLLAFAAFKHARQRGGAALRR